MPAQAPPCYRRRVVRAGLGIGAVLTAVALAAAAQADALSALPGTLIYLEGQWISALLFAGLLCLGVSLQVLGAYRASPKGLRCALLGAALVVGAGLFDRDPVLVVGQVVLVAALWPAATKKIGQPVKCGQPQKCGQPGQCGTSAPGEAQRNHKPR